MKARDIDDPFFRGKALLLVEDPLTRVTLTSCWSQNALARQITVRAVGGHDAVQALVQAAREERHGHVFGLVDRDFAPPSSPDGPVQRTERHEIENHLLDFDALANFSDLGADVIRSRALDVARSLRSWMALRYTLLYVQQQSWRFPETPRPSAVSTLTDAQSWLRDKAIGQGFGRDAQTFTAAYLEGTLLPEHDTRCANDLASGAWVETFSGKEILRQLRGTRELWRRPFTTDDDLGRAVAEHWCREMRVPAFIDALRDRLLRAGGL